MITQEKWYREALDRPPSKPSPDVIVRAWERDTWNPNLLREVFRLASSSPKIVGELTNDPGTLSIRLIGTSRFKIYKLLNAPFSKFFAVKHSLSNYEEKLRDNRLHNWRLDEKPRGSYSFSPYPFPEGYEEILSDKEFHEMRKSASEIWWTLERGISAFYLLRYESHLGLYESALRALLNMAESFQEIKAQADDYTKKMRKLMCWSKKVLSEGVTK